jgi:glucose-1-phosphate adenylyltransferase
MMGADYYETDADSRPGRPQIGIGDNSHIENAIIDKNACVGRNVTITNLARHQVVDDGKTVLRDGIVIVPRGNVIPDGYSV